MKIELDVNGARATSRRRRGSGCSTCCARTCASPAPRKAAARASAARARCCSTAARVNSCLVAVGQCDGRTVLTTVEGLARRTALHRSAGGARRARRRAVRHLHAGHPRGRRTRCSPRTRQRRRRRDPRGSPATSAAAPATSGSSSRSGTPRTERASRERRRLALYPFAAPAPALAELCRTLSARAGRRDRTVLLAGGTDWIVERGLAPPERPGRLPLVLDVSRLPELRGIQVARSVLRSAPPSRPTSRSGSRSRVSAARPAPARRWRATSARSRSRRAAPSAATSRPRLPRPTAWRALVALDAGRACASVRGERRVPFDAFFTRLPQARRGRDELIVAIEIALPRRRAPCVAEGRNARGAGDLEGRPRRGRRARARRRAAS